MNIQKTTTLIKKDADTRGNEGHFVGLADGMSNACVMNSDAEAQNSDAPVHPHLPRGPQ